VEQAAEAAGLAWATVRRAHRRVAVARKNGAGGRGSGRYETKEIKLLRGKLTRHPQE
jgi:hypothetical protein